jgi:hypothetical protein
MCYIKGECYYWYYFTSLFHMFITSSTDALHASLFVIVYIYVYSTRSPNIALFSCLLRTLGIVLVLYAQYHQLLTSDSSCLISCRSRTQPCSSVLHTSFYVPRNILAEFPWYSEELVLKPQSILANSNKLPGYEVIITSSRLVTSTSY